MTIQKNIIILFLVLILSSCVTTGEECDFSLRGTSEYSLCRASQGSKEFQYRAGMEAFLLGDQDAAKKWFKRSAKFISNKKSVYVPPEVDDYIINYDEFKNGDPERGHEAAFYMLAKIYDEGIGVKVDTKKSRDYARRAAKLEIDVVENERNFSVQTRRILSRNENGDVEKSFELSSFKVDKKK